MGLVLLGLWTLVSHVRALAGQALSQRMARLQARGLSARAIGLVMGALVQSPSTTAGVCASQIVMGHISRSEALRVFLWSHPGSAMLVLLAAFDLRALLAIVFGTLGASFLLGIDKRETPRHALTALLGAAVMLLGVAALTRDPAGVPAFAPVITLAGVVQAHPWMAFILGLLFSTVLRSPQVVALLSFALLQADLLSLEGVVPLIYGASLRWVIGTHTVASPHDRAWLTLAQVGRRVRLGAIAALCLWYGLETGAQVAGPMALVRLVSSQEAVQVALLYLLCQCAIAALGELVGVRLLDAALRRVDAPMPAQTLSGRTKFLDPQALGDASSALALAHAEFTSLVSELPSYLDELRESSGPTAVVLPLETLHRDSVQVVDRIDGFLSETLQAHPDMAGMERLFQLRARLAALRRLQATLHTFASALASVPRALWPPQAGAMCESLHAVLQVAADTLAAQNDPAALELLQSLTGDRGPWMDSVRMAILQGLAQGSSAQREAMLDASLYFEKCLWMLPKVVHA